MSNTSELSGQSAVVTGASSGIDRAIAERLGASGAFGVLAGRDEKALELAAQRITESGGGAEIVVADVRRGGVVQGLIDTAVGTTGRLDILVNNAGVIRFAIISDSDPQLGREMPDTNVFALLVGCQAVVRAMRATPSPGPIINISSVAALDPSSGVYGALRHAVNAILNTLRIELVDDPIQVTTIMTGIVATDGAPPRLEPTRRTRRHEWHGCHDRPGRVARRRGVRAGPGGAERDHDQARGHR
jgi:NADP-dependent 3-hydroxy acid dehydrogenase YdfG